MEILVTAIIASIKLYRTRERMVSEPNHFQAFDLPALKQVYAISVRPGVRSPQRPGSYRVQTAS